MMMHADFIATLWGDLLMSINVCASSMRPQRL